MYITTLETPVLCGEDGHNVLFYTLDMLNISDVSFDTYLRIVFAASQSATRFLGFLRPMCD